MKEGKEGVRMVRLEGRNEKMGVRVGGLKGGGRGSDDGYGGLVKMVNGVGVVYGEKD